jgi:hypothetical protein
MSIQKCGSLETNQKTLGFQIDSMVNTKISTILEVLSVNDSNLVVIPKIPENAKIITIVTTQIDIVCLGLYEILLSFAI